MVRCRGPAPAAAALARRAAPGGRAGRAGGPGPLPARLAGHPQPSARPGDVGGGASGCCRGAPLVASTPEARRAAGCACSATGPADLDERCAPAATLVWVGAGGLGASGRPGAPRPSGTSCRCSASRLTTRSGRTGASTRPSACTWQQQGASFWATSSGRRRPGASDRELLAPCGTSCGPERSPTTRWRRCGRS